jgi:hypothetical protein
LELDEKILKNNCSEYNDIVSQQIKTIMDRSNNEYKKFGDGVNL